ncbi:hypothetical protein GQ43DRAFT_150854 [Delitschia confertaspora ATCC 74209]|uniref:RRM domain-containing protein n=1 Tax=Delitschia confertaspora ATCC 74209 TaxID=1513339 RepID=A0A9P4JIB7_9PLEO|nr:hypothetical protein GQ43DRAFT_150854 [Delitschia confertaspora ATCC 74209]
MISSPPQEAEHIRGKTLTPESPKPLHYPSPSNIPILEKSMDPKFHETSFNIGTPALYQSYPQQTQTPSVPPNNAFYPPQQGYQNAAVDGAVGAGPGDYTQSTSYGNGYGSNTQDTSIHSFPSQNDSLPSFSEAKPAAPQDYRPSYPMNYDPNSYPTAQSQAQPPQGSQAQPTLNTNENENGVDFQALLDNLSPSMDNKSSTDRNPNPSVSAQPSQVQGLSAMSCLPAAANLPPRPPAQDKPATHPNYNPNDDIRSYHPHSQKPRQLQPLNVQGAVANNAHAQSAPRSNPTPSTPNYAQRDSLGSQAGDDDEDRRWPPEINKLYEDFLEEERNFVTEGQWDQFPSGSRLFIGNLPSEKVTKRDVFHRFYRHGKLAQISIKQAYGFVQFLDVASCHRALEAEQGQTIRGRKMHLEISKPQRNTKPQDAVSRNGARRRSRSPDYTRGGTSQQGGRNVDRYTGNAMSPRDRDFRRGRDDYRPVRSPSPRGRNGRRDRSRDRYDGRRRSRSRSPLGRGGGRYRSPSPRGGFDDDLPLPHRAPHQVPDVQVIVVNDLPRDFIGWVEDTFRQRGLRIDVLILSPRLSEAAVVRRQILEGVLAIVKLNASSVAKGRIDLQVFDRRGGADNVRFEEYADLDPGTASMLVLNKKQSLSQPAPPSVSVQYGQNYGAAPQLGQPPYTGAQQPPQQPPQQPQYQYPPPIPTSNSTSLSGLISSLDTNSLQQLLGAMSQNNPSQPQPLQQSNAGLNADLARLLGSVPPPQMPPSVPQNSYQNNPYGNINLASLMGQPRLPQASPAAAPMRTPTQATPGQPDMNEIMAQLARYQR